MQQSHHIPIFVHRFRAIQLSFYLLFPIFLEGRVTICLACKLFVHSKVFMMQVQATIAALKISRVVEAILMPVIQSALICHNWNNQIIRKGEIKITKKIYVEVDFCILTTRLSSSYTMLLPSGLAIFPLQGTWSKELFRRRSDFSPQLIESSPSLVLFPARKPRSETMYDGALIYSRGTERQFWPVSPSAARKKLRLS